MNTLPETILLHASALPEGGVLSPKEFLHLGSRAAVDQAFSRLAKAGKMLRVARGAYTAPVSSRFGTRAPEPEKVIRAMAAQSGEIVTPHGASAANTLGPTHADESLASLRRTLPHAEWKALTLARATLPAWMAQAIGKEAARG